MKRLEDYVMFHATEHGHRVAVVCGEKCVDYSQLLQLVQERAAHIAMQDAKAVLLKATPSIDFLVCYLATHLADKVFVPLEKDIPDTRLTEIKDLIEESEIPEGVADILFTTGTTGHPKGSMLSQLAIVSNGENLIEAQGFAQGLAFVISGPLSHIGSLSKLWPVLMVGGTIILTEGLKDIKQFYKAFMYPSRKFATFLVPSNLRFLLQFDRERWTTYAPLFDFIETGAAPMSQVDMEELSRLFPQTRLYNTYASTETGIIATHDYCHDGCIAGCLGRPMKHSQIIITTEGTVACQGPTLMTGYLGDKLLTVSVLKDGFLYTNDLGRIDERGRLRLEGRKDDIINIGGYKVSPVEIENVTMAYKGVADCICVARRHPIMGNVLKLIYVVDETGVFQRNMLIHHLKQHLEHYKVPTLYEHVPRIARTYNGKLDRKYYGQ